MFNYKFTLKNTFEAINWLKEQILKLRSTLGEKEEKEEKKDGSKQDTFEIGKMYLFHYDPKTKKKLKYYDTYPLILLVDISQNGRFYGVNLHYLPPEYRLKLLSNLADNLSVYKDNKIERLRLSYNILNSYSLYKAFKPCFKQYLFSHIKSVIKEIPPEDWGYACALPIENFKKEIKQNVWIESLNAI